MCTGTFNFLILGAGRGGTSLLAGMLDYHSRLEVELEKHAVAILMGQDAAPAHETQDQRLARFVQACTASAADFPHQYWGNKITTEQLAAVAACPTASDQGEQSLLARFFLNHLRDVKILFILRDGRTCVRSKMARANLSAEQAIARWHYSVEVCQFAQATHPRCLVVKYEDLVARPHPLLQQTCEFLEIDYEQGMLAGTANRKMLADYQQTGLNANPLSLEGIPPDWHTRMADALRAAGYADSAHIV